MNNGKFIYSKPGSDEILGEVTFSIGFNMLAKLALERGGVKYPDPVTVGCLAGLIAGEEAGIEGVEIGDLRKVTPDTVARAMCKVDVELVEPEKGEEEPEKVEDEADANPTGTSGGNC